MALDRQTIEKRDFPIGRRGYDPEAVDAHLALLADEVEAIKRSSRSRGDTLASAASEQVRLIVEAAEQSASDIEREADLEARRIRQEARESAEKQRSEASDQAREHVQRVSEAAATMLERIDSMESELRNLLDSLRSGAQRVTSDLSLLQGAVGDLRGTSFQAEDDATPAPTSTSTRSSRTRAGSASAAGASPEPAVAEPEEPEPADEPVAVERNGAGADEERPADEEGARLIALNMALNGTPRDETEKYLQDNFELDDPQGLLDDVYARAGQ